MRGVRYLGVIFAIMLFTGIVSAGSSSQLSIGNSPPYFKEDIRNYSWEEGPLLNVLNLNDYFTDFQKDRIEYFTSNTSNIKVEIAVDNKVSFFPSENFTGTEVIQFTANDGVYNTTSNFIELYVGKDLTAPMWESPFKSKIKVYNEDPVTFNVTWSDERALMNYTFYINQTGEWELSSGRLKGMKDIMSEEIEITAKKNNSVKWKACASDTSLNTACTGVYEFPILERPTFEYENEEEYKGDIEEIKDQSSSDDFSLDVSSFFVTLKQGSDATQVFEIVNNGDVSLDFDLELQNLKKSVFLSESTFSLGAGESKLITIDFDIDLNLEPGEYLGYLVVHSSEEVFVPIVLNINELNLDYEVSVDVVEKEVNPGKNVLADISIVSIKDQSPAEVTVYYAVKDFYGVIYDSFEEKLTLDKSLELEKELSIPSESDLGNYLYYVRVSNEKASSRNSDVFIVGGSFRFDALLEYSFVFILIIFLSSVFLVLTLRHNRKKKRHRSIELYMKLTELKNLVKDGKYDKAAKLYINIKKNYGKGVSTVDVSDKDRLAKVIEGLVNKIDFEDIVEEATSEDETEDKKESTEDGAEKSSEKEAPEDSKEESKEKSKDEEKESVEKKVLEKKKEDSKEGSKEEKKPVEEVKEKIEENKSQEVKEEEGEIKNEESK